MLKAILTTMGRRACISARFMHIKEIKSCEKPIPNFRSGKEAEDFVAQADLGEYDLSGGEVVRFEMRPKDKMVSLRLPAQLLEAVRGEAKREGVPYQRFIRMAIESALHGAAP
jgi:predicted DNA binding CopG/RHH family protein